jgi:hypothetical protein
VELDDAAHFVVEDRPDAVVTAASELAGAR